MQTEVTVQLGESETALQRVYFRSKALGHGLVFRSVMMRFRSAAPCHVVFFLPLNSPV